MRFGLVVVLSGLFALAAAKPAAGQAWDAPSFMPSHPVDELGAFALNPPFADFGVMGLWRQSGNLGLGVRAGIVDLEPGGTAFVVGSEFYASLLRATPASPLEAMLVVGAGATFEEGILARIPVGLSVGARFADGARELAFSPYVHPRLGLEILANDDETETELAFGVDFGLDVELSRTITLRGAYTWVQGEFAEDALGVGLVIRAGRRIDVR
jgi:opacity protein-like surface antigen